MQDALLSATWAKKQDDKGKGYGFSMSDSMSWSWQFCSQFGFFQDTNQTDPLNLISRFNNPDILRVRGMPIYIPLTLPSALT